ncbi:hypothetical protein L596_016526 [Steinernema carpocapsae]|uniref:G-protein coupled receptors family 1 profile domain-containing protein n=1 Tax=Steinernema carpocapsae TaxID=34508 RepID=A0A4U5NJ54_STECR|nr:hypothetical protein L596_016526 [Steinernema carpocapsae]
MNSTGESDCKCQEGVFSHEPVNQIIVAFVDYVLIGVIIWASLKVEKNDLCRVYTLWLCLCHVPFDLAMLIISPLQMKGIVDNTGRLYNNDLNLVPLIGKFFQDVASQVYRILALLMVAMTYTSYKHPFLHYKFFRQSRRSKVFLFGFVFILIQVTLGNTMTLVDSTENQKNITWNIAREILFYTIQVLGNGPIVLMMVLYIASIKAILQYTRKRLEANLQGNSADNFSQ